MTGSVACANCFNDALSPSFAYEFKQLGGFLMPIDLLFRVRFVEILI